MDTDHQADEAWTLGVQRKLYQWSKAHPDDAWRDMWGWFTDLQGVIFNDLNITKGRYGYGVGYKYGKYRYTNYEY